MKLRILIFVTRMNVGGVTSLILEQISKSSNPDLEYFLVYGRTESNEIEDSRLRELPCKIYRLNYLQRSINPIKDLLAFIEFIRILRIIKPQIIHSHMFKAGLVSRVANLIMLNKKITIHTFHGELTEGYFGGIKVFLYLLIEKILSNFTSSFIAVSKDTKNSLIDRGIGHIKKWIVINPGVDFKKVGSYSRNKKSTPTVIWVGRFERVKDPILAIQTFHELKMLSSHSYNVLMIGNGSLWGKASQLNFENKLNIKLTGWLNSIEKHLKSGHILFMTSVNEGFGLVALEAAKYSIPTISTDCGGIRDFIVDGKNGILTSREPKEIASKLDKLIRNSSEVRRLGNNAYKLAHKKFSISDYIRKNEKLYFRIYVSKK